MNTHRPPAMGLCAWFTLNLAIHAGALEIVESKRAIPVYQEVDVVVVGGSSGAVAAALAAAEHGASVFLLSPRPYLGTDICAPLRLWIDREPTDVLTPLSRALFVSSVRYPGFPFTYTTQTPSVKPHQDSGTQLTDGLCTSAQNQSVQYNENVQLLLDLEQPRRVTAIRIMAYQRDQAFEVEKAVVEISADGQRWEEAGVIANTKLHAGNFEDEPLELTAEMDATPRWIRLSIHKTERAPRMLLGEIVVSGPDAVATSAEPVATVTPLHVKRTLAAALIEKDIPFLLEAMPTDLLRDADGAPAGIVMASRSGRQAIKAKAIIDASPRALVARLAGAAFTAPATAPRIFKRIVIGGAPAAVTPPTRVRALTPDLSAGRTRSPAFEYTLLLPMRDDSPEAFAEAEQTARDLTWHPRQIESSEFPLHIPPNTIESRGKTPGAWPGAARVNLDVFRPAGIEHLFVLSGYADMPRAAVEKLFRPVELIQAGDRLGRAAAAVAAQRSAPRDVRVAGPGAEHAQRVGDIRELLGETGREKGGSVPSAERALPVLGRYDVVVVGGGTGGAPAGIGAARMGAKTLVVEYLHGLGGTGTLGMIGNYWYGHRVGFTLEIDQAVGAVNAEGRRVWRAEDKMEWYRKELRKAGGTLWTGCAGSGVLMEGNRVKGVVVVTPEGRGIVLCRTVIDTTGNADIAAAAGAKTRFAGEDLFALQGTGLSSGALGQSSNNSDWDYVRDSDVVDRTRMHALGATVKYPNEYNLSPLIVSRERRSIEGEYTLTPLDVERQRTFHDTIAMGRSNLDSHGYTIHPLYRFYFPPLKEALTTHIPYRCLLPRGLEGMLVAAIGASFHRDALPVVRMQPDVQNTGYAAGVAAAMALKQGVDVRDVDIRALQRHLVEKGNLPAEVPTHADSGQPGPEQLAEAVKRLASGGDYATVLDAPTEQALPLVRQAYAAAADRAAQVRYAHLLAVLGDAHANATLREEVRSRPWDKGWTFVGMGNHGSGLSELDSFLLALGETGDAEALSIILEKLAELSPQSDFSHFRVCALALSKLADPGAAPALARALAMPGMRGHATVTMREAVQKTPPGSRDNSSREGALRELLLAEALFKCGDHQGLGKEILTRYTHDLRGVFSLYARRALGNSAPPPPIDP